MFPSGVLQPMDVKKIKNYDKIVPIFTTGRLSPDSRIAQGTAGKLEGVPSPGNSIRLPTLSAPRAELCRVTRFMAQ